MNSHFRMGPLLVLILLSCAVPCMPAATLTIVGRVTLDNGAPAAGAKIEILRFRDVTHRRVREVPIAATTTTLTGEFSHTLPVGQFTDLRVSMPGRATLQAQVYVPMPCSADRQERRDFVLQPCAPITGRVLSPDNKPVSSATIAAGADLDYSRIDTSKPYVGYSRTVSSGDGSFRFDETSSGPLRLTVNADGHVPLQTTCTAPVLNKEIRLAVVGAQICGTVTNMSTRRPVAGARVMLGCTDHWVEDRESTSDLNGAFHFDHLPGARFSLDAQAEGLGLFSPSVFQGTGEARWAVKLSEKETTRGIELLMYPGHTITGRALERETGQPLAGVRVQVFRQYVHDDASSATVTGADGRYTLGGIFPDMSYPQIDLTISKPGYGYARPAPCSSMPSVRVTGDNPVATGDFLMTRSTVVTGYVRSESGQPVPDAKVEEVRPTARVMAPVESDGSFRLDIVPDPAIVLKAVAPGFAPSYSVPIVRSVDQPMRRDFTLGRGARVSGTIVDKAGQTISRAHIEATGSIRSGDNTTVDTQAAAVSGPDGSFSLQGIPAGEITITVEADGYPRSKPLVQAMRGTEQFEQARIVLDKGRFVSGVVVAPDGSPLKSCMLKVSFSPHANQEGTPIVCTDETGHFLMQGLEKDEIPLMVEWQGGYKLFANTRTGNSNLRLVFDEFVTLKGKVVDSMTQAPLEFETEWYLQKTRGKGQFELRVPRPSCNYVVLPFRSAGYLPASENISVFPGASVVEHNVLMGHGGSVAGHVTDRSTGRPVAGCRVVAKVPATPGDMNPLPTAAVTGPDGAYKLDGLPATYVPIEAHAPTGTASDRREVLIQHGATAEADFEL